MQQWGERKVCLLSGGWAFCLVQPGAMKGIRLYLYARQAPNARDGKELFRSMTNVSRENGSKTAVTRVKLEVRRSELWEWADPAEVSVAAGRKERRWWSAIVWSVYSIARISGGGSALQGSSRTSYATGKKKIKKKSVCVRYVLYQTSAASPESPLAAQLDVQLSQADTPMHGKEQDDNAGSLLCRLGEPISQSKCSREK